MKQSKKTLGNWGEAKAAEFLQKKGIQLLQSNYYTRYGEIDLIMQEQETVLFVEVKLRKNQNFARAADAVTPAKQKKMILTAQAWLEEHECTKIARFDVVEVYAPKGTTGEYQLNWIPNAFEVT